MIAAIFRTVSADWSARRIQAANWRDLAALAASPRTQARHGYAARMLDRIGLLQPRLALAKRPDDVMAADALKDLRVGRDITELQRARRHLPMAEPVLRPVLDGLARYFRDRSSWRGGQKTPEFLAQIDRALAGVAGAPAGRPRATARWWRWWASAAPSSPTLPSTNPPIPTWRATHHDRRIQSLRHLLPWLLVLGVVTLGVAWALRRLLARRPVPAGMAPGAVRPGAVRGAAVRRHPDIPHIFQRLA